VAEGCGKRGTAIVATAPTPAAVASVPAGGSPAITKPIVWDVPADMRRKVIREQRGAFNQKVVALTFDDGPSPNVTPQVLQILEKEGIRATFFMVGVQMQRNPEMAKTVLSKGHVLGAHTYTHSWHPNPKMAQTEFEKWEALGKELTGKETRLFRPPFGRTKSAYSQMALKRGYPLILWTNTGADTSKRATPATIYTNVVKNIRPGDIVLLHDNDDKEKTAKALPRIIATLKKQGYSFVSVPEILEAWETEKKAHLPKTSEKKRNRSKKSSVKQK
jgi:peptidoglycan/xylan/chitin deacetylase (PgdA/CDA1 family)